MRTKVTLVLIFLNVALFFFIFYFEREWRQIERIKETRLRVLDATAANIQKLEITGLAEAIQLERRGEEWMLTSPFVWPANPHAVKRILNELLFLEREAYFTLAELAATGVTLADYGLDKPAITLSLTPGNPSGGSGPGLDPIVLRIGSETKAGNRLYLLSPDGERVLVVKRSLADSLRLTLDELREPALFKIPSFEVRSLSVQAAAANNLRVRLRKDGNRWSLETPILARASKIATDLALNNLTHLAAAQFPPQSTVDLARTGLAAPSLRIALEGNKRSETLLVGARVGDKLAASPDESLFYAKLEDRDAIFTTAIPNALVDTLRNAQETLRDRLVLDLEGRVISGITLRSANQRELTLQRLEIGAAAGDVGTWQIVRRDPGATGTPTLPADAQAVARLLQHLTLLTAEEFRSDAPSAADLENWGFNLPERRITLTVAPALPPASGPPPATTQIVLDLGLSTESGGAVYAKLENQDFVYKVRPSILSETPVVDQVFRNKRLRELPAGAQITGLSLVRIADDSILFARTLADNETWKTALTAEPAPRQAAIETLLAQLRNLRAKSIHATSFPAVIALDGVDQPWTYRLEVSVALVAGAGAQITTSTLFLSERTGGGTQLIGSPDLDVVFLAEQELLDAFWTLIFGPRDPGPPSAEAFRTPPIAAPAQP